MRRPLHRGTATDWLHVFLFVCINLKTINILRRGQEEERRNAMEIFGVKRFGIKFFVEKLSHVVDYSIYDSVCFVTDINRYNGNGEFEIEIVDKEENDGFQVGDWRIIKANVKYWWYSSQTQFVMSDKEGYEKTITMKSYIGSVNGFMIDVYIRDIFYKAQTVADNCIRASTFDAISEYEDGICDYSWDSYLDNVNKSNLEPSDFIERLGYASSKIAEYVEKYEKVIKYLKECEEPNADALIDKITRESYENLKRFKYTGE